MCIRDRGCEVPLAPQWLGVQHGGHDDRLDDGDRDGQQEELECGGRRRAQVSIGEEPGVVLQPDELDVVRLGNVEVGERHHQRQNHRDECEEQKADDPGRDEDQPPPVSYTHLRAHETVLDLVCRLLLEKKTTKKKTTKEHHRHT